MSSYKNFWPEELSWLNKQRLILHIEWFSNSLSIMAGSGQHPSSFHHGDRVFIIFAKIVTTILWTKSFGKVPAQFGLLFCSGFISLPGSSKGPLGFSLFCLSSALLHASLSFVLASFVISDLELMLPSSFLLLYTKTVKSASWSYQWDISDRVPKLFQQTLNINFHRLVFHILHLILVSLAYDLALCNFSRIFHYLL